MGWPWKTDSLDPGPRIPRRGPAAVSRWAGQEHQDDSPAPTPAAPPPGRYLQGHVYQGPDAQTWPPTLPSKASWPPPCDHKSLERGWISVSSSFKKQNCFFPRNVQFLKLSIQAGPTSREMCLTQLGNVLLLLGARGSAPTAVTRSQPGGADAVPTLSPSAEWPRFQQVDPPARGTLNLGD